MVPMLLVWDFYLVLSKSCSIKTKVRFYNPYENEKQLPGLPDHSATQAISPVSCHPWLHFGHKYERSSVLYVA